MEEAAPPQAAPAPVSATTAEPVAPAAAEPVAPAAAEPTPTPEPVATDPVKAETAPTPVEAIPAAEVPAETQESPSALEEIQKSMQAADFDWDSWELANTEALPEEVRDWAQRIMHVMATKHKGSLEQAQAAANRWEGLWNSMLDGEEDPRIAEAEGRVENMKTKMAEQEKAMNALNERVEQIVEQQTNRYTEWFIHNYPDLVNDATRFDAMADLSDKLSIEWHDTVEIQNLGSGAVEEAITRAKAGKDMQDTMELLRLKYGGKKPQQTTRQEKTSQKLAAASDRPPPTTKNAPSKLDSSDLNGNILNVVKSMLSKNGPRR